MIMKRHKQAFAIISSCFKAMYQALVNNYSLNESAWTIDQTTFRGSNAIGRRDKYVSELAKFSASFKKDNKPE